MKLIQTSIDYYWYVYILQCADLTYYIGITPDIEKRLTLHNSGKGAKYTRGRGPLTLVYHEQCGNKSEASKREHELKKLTRKEKEELINARDSSSSRKSGLTRNDRSHTS